MSNTCWSERASVQEPGTIFTLFIVCEEKIRVYRRLWVKVQEPNRRFREELKPGSRSFTWTHPEDSGKWERRVPAAGEALILILAEKRLKNLQKNTDSGKWLFLDATSYRGFKIHFISLIFADLKLFYLFHLLFGLNVPGEACEGKRVSPALRKFSQGEDLPHFRVLPCLLVYAL